MVSEFLLQLNILTMTILTTSASTLGLGIHFSLNILQSGLRVVNSSSTFYFSDKNVHSLDVSLCFGMISQIPLFISISSCFLVLDCF